MDDDKPIMTDLDADEAPEVGGAQAKKSWIKRFASIFGLAGQGQGGAYPGNGPMGGGGY